ncbi:carbohydrate-binding domain-containing protein [Mycolicibacterium sphagni]|uniref:Glycosyl hydrolase family protein n=1 Tax=Mycolicibacterium sphagni TaxID=1786 RepID=A0ABX2JZH7_9MYCO|nr:carbohydrate-binding domain-containing protein [Mycolicibacterium sphagni]NTY60238.1 glycosyl hydrolase family protein [Mycolicibacterium sphagni]
MFRSCSAIALAVAVAWGGVQVVVAPAARAAGTTAIEADAMSVLTGKGTTKYVDATASGGTALALTGAVTVATNLSLPDSVRVVVRAKARQCLGAPIGRVSIDGVDIGTSPVTAATWTDYTATAPIAAGAHTVGVSFTNPFWLGCSRVLYIDTVSIVAATASSSPDTLTAAPVADLPGWTHTFADNFTRDAPLGSWANLSNPTKVVYVGSDGQQWLTYPQTFTDTYQHRPYRADEVLSVSNGTMDFYLHNVAGQPAGANPSPVLPGGTQYQTYGRYSARLKVDTPTLSEYHIAFLLWPKSELWPNDGEEDFPEGALSSTSNAYAHYARATGGQDGVGTGVMFTDWHVYTIEWLPGHIRFYLDDDLVLDSTKYIPSKPMRWQLQVETDGNGTNSGHLLVDWVSVWSYAGG